MTLSKRPEEVYIQIPDFTPPESPAFPEVPTSFLRIFTLKNMAYHAFAIVSATTHGLNSFMAGIALGNMMEGHHSASLGEIIENPMGCASPLTFCVSTVFGFCSFFVNYAQLLDYMPKMKSDLLSLKILTQNISKNKKIALSVATGLSVAAATSNSIFAWDTYSSIKNDSARYPLSVISLMVSFAMTFAVRFVRTKQKIEENPYFYSQEEYFLLEFIKKIKKKHQQNLHRDDDLGRAYETSPFIESFITVCKERGITLSDPNELEEILVKLMKEKNLPFKQSQIILDFWKILYILSCTLMGAIIFGEKTAGLIPRIDDSMLWDIARLCCGIFLSTSHIITYYSMAYDIFEVIPRSFKTSPQKALSWFLVNMGAAPSMCNYFLNIINKKHILPLSNYLAFNAFFTSFNPNYESCANKYIFPKPSFLEKDLQNFRKAIIEEKPIHHRANYLHASQTLKSAFFAPPHEEKEKPGCWMRLRQKIGF